MYGLAGYGDYSNRKKASEAAADAMSQEEQDSWLRTLSRNTGSTIETIGKTLDTPGAIARGVLAGDPTSGFSWDSDRRTTGEELLQSYGLLGKQDNSYLSAGLGLAAEIATDPLSFLTLPMSSLTKAGKAAKAAGILDNASLAAQKKLGASAADSITGRAAESALNRLQAAEGIAKTDATYAIRPLVGPRVARTQTSLSEVIAAADDPSKALDDVTKYFSGKGMNYDAYKNERLGGAFGLGLIEPMVTFTPPGSGKVLDALDAAGQAIGWSKPARVASALFDQRVGGMIDSGDQISALRQFKGIESAKNAGRRAAQQHAETVTRIPMSSQAKALLGADSLLSERGNDFLTRVFENKPTSADRALMRELPGINDAVSSWDKIRTTNVANAKQLGLDYTELTDPRFGVAYSPRAGTEFDFGEYGEGYGRSQFNTRAAESMSRNPDLFTPGGTTDLREVSMLPLVREFAQKGSDSQSTAEQVGTEITRYLNNKHGRNVIEQEQGEAIARVMYRLNKDLPSNVPAFAAHPLNEQSRVIVSQEVARSNAKFVYESLVESAISQRANRVAGSGYKRLDAAASEIAGKVGLKTDSAGLDPAVRQQIVDRVAAKFGLRPDQVDLSQLAIPESVYNRLSKIQDFYASPRAQEEVSGMFDQFTQVFKSFLLAFPARHVRDMYSNTFSVWLETGSPTATLNGFSIAKRVMAGDIDSVLPQISKLPQYQGIADPNVIKQRFLSDVAGTGVLTSLAQSDLITAKRSGELSKIFPGLTPVTRMGAFKEFIPDGSRNPLQMLGDFASIQGVTNKYETRNPLLNWSQKLSDANDSIARLGGMVALMSQGNTAEVAAQRITSALVDYSSLTTFERGVMRKIFNWYSYTSKIGKYVVQSMIEKPGGLYGQTMRAMNTLQQSTDETYVPERLRQQVSVRIPDELLSYLGMPQEPGTTTSLTDFDLPGMDALSLINPRSLQGTIGNILGQANPFIKGTAELAFNQDLFSKRSLNDADPAVNKVYRRLTGGELSNVAKVVGSNIPGTQRILGLAGSLMDDRIPMSQRIPKTGINSLAGVKVAVTDRKDVIDDAQRQLDQRMSPYTKSFERTFIDKDKIVSASPEEQRLAILSKVLAAQKRKDAAARNPKPPPQKRKPRQRNAFDVLGMNL